MDLEKMNNSINEMEEIVSKMRTIKDSYKLLEASSEKNEDILNKLNQQLKEIDKLYEKVQKSYKEFYDLNDSINRNLGAKMRDVETELSGLRKCVDEKTTNVSEDIKSVEDSFQEQKRRHSCYLKILIVFSVVNLIVQLIELIK